MESFENLNAFYLGREYDPNQRQDLPNYLLYDSKDLLTHAVCVGMTGSGKTGLCLSLLEEAAIDGIPAIVIDPKGDMANLFLAFPDLAPEDFRPWINETEAVNAGQTPDEFAAAQAKVWSDGLRDWGQDGKRIAMMREKTDFALYTPGSTAAAPISVLQQLTPKSVSLEEDQEVVLEQISSTVSGLLSLLGIDADPIQSREHILLSNLLINAAQSGVGMDIATLIASIQQPSIQKIGVIDMEDFYPAKDRLALALKINNLLASPKFATWMQGDPLDIDRLLYSASGKPKISVLSISHLNDAERMFFVTILLNQVLSWTRQQSGTGSLRAILYMDEIFGFFPPVATPPSKAPLLTLLKQARAFGLGVVLTTQNPADLDYKGLSNTGTWFIGRLQTERDKARVLEGLEGAAASQGTGFDRQQMDQLLSGLDKRVFLMNNVHDRAPTLLRTRWCMSYLRGPLTRNLIQKLYSENPAIREASSGSAMIPNPSSSSVTAQQESIIPVMESAPAPANVAVASPSPNEAPIPGGMLPNLPLDIRQYVLSKSGATAYVPTLLGIAQIGYKDAGSGMQSSQELALYTALKDGVFVADWDEAEELEYALDQLDTALPAGASTAALPEAARLSRNYTAWKRELTDWLFRNKSVTLLENPDLKMMALPGESERDFQIRIQQRVREDRDAAIEALRKKFAVKIQSLEEKIRKAEQAVDREKEQAKTQGLQTAISVGATFLSAFMGKKRVSASSVGKATTAARGASRTMKEQGDIKRTKDTVDAYKEQLKALEEQIETDTQALSDSMDQAATNISEKRISPMKKDILIRSMVILWVAAD